MTQPELDPPQPIPPPQLPHIDPLIAQYINMTLETFRQQLFDEIMATVMDNIKPLQHSLATPRSGSSLRPNPPPPFDGSCELGKGFLETCMLYIQLRPGDFPDDAMKLGWILTFMTSGRALTWRNGILTDFAEKSAYPWESMTGFVAEFQREFYPISADEDALVVLEGSSYFQKSGKLVDSYVDRFRELSKRAELVDARTLIIKLRRGLLPYIAEALTDSSNPPASNDMEQWIKRGPELREKSPVAEEPHRNQAESSPILSIKSLRSPPSTTQRFACRTCTSLSIQSYSSGRILVHTETSGSDAYGCGHRPGSLAEC